MTSSTMTRFGWALALSAIAGCAWAQTAPAPAAAPQARETDEAAFKRIDKNADNQLSLDEFKAELDARRRAAALRRLQRQFQAMDKNHSGNLESAEFYELPIVKATGAKAPQFGAVDGNHDAKIDFKEYVAMVARFAASK